MFSRSIWRTTGGAGCARPELEVNATQMAGMTSRRFQSLITKQFIFPPAPKNGNRAAKRLISLKISFATI
jgi:hypothetical protein